MLFKEIKNAISVTEAAKHYGIEVKSNGMCRCPFHDDKHPSMKLYNDNYHCFGCGEHGDVIDMVGNLFGLSALQSAEKIIMDFGLPLPTGNDPSPIKKKHRIAKTNEALRSEKINRAFYMALREMRQSLISCKEKIDDWKYAMAPKSKDIPSERWDVRFYTAHRWSDYIAYLIDIIDFGENYDRLELIAKRKEVEDLAKWIIAEPETTGCSRTRAVS